MRVEEADGCDAAQHIADRCSYAHIATRPYPNDPDEGLAFLCKYPLRSVESGWDTGFAALEDCGLRARVSVGRVEFAITNVHLDCENIRTREDQISQVLEWIEGRSEEGCYELLCGDFNCPPDSSVYRFLIGQQTLLSRGIKPWHDLARYRAEKVGKVPSPTLDFWNTPRWRDTPTLEIPARFDWILLQDVFNRGLPYPGVPNAGVFGTGPTPRVGVVPSDHYGVYADLDFGPSESRAAGDNLPE
jgi:maltose 6'-phosphate phosphatase